MKVPLLTIIAATETLVYTAHALTIDFENSESIQTGLATVAKGLMDYYIGNSPGSSFGEISAPYHWWEAGMAWGSILDYWYYTGDETYNTELSRSLLHRAGENWDSAARNHTRDEGNDDQGFWGITAMAAAEKNFPHPDPNSPQWLHLAQNVFDTLVSRWDSENCDGGLRWQIYSANNGYTYKNSAANGCLFHLASRLYRFTGNETYAQWATKTWDWVVDKQFIETNTTDWRVRDGASVADNCQAVDPRRWTYNAGFFLAGSAFMYNATGDTQWLTKADHLWEGAKVFFSEDKIMYESSCQTPNQCNRDQGSFKAIFSRFLGLTAVLAPSLKTEIMLRLQTTAPAVLSSCAGGPDGTACGFDWTKGSWDGVRGLGEQMSALEALQNLLVFTRPGPLTSPAQAANSVENQAVFLEGESSLDVYKRKTEEQKARQKHRKQVRLKTLVSVLSILGLFLILFVVLICIRRYLR